MEKINTANAKEFLTAVNNRCDSMKDLTDKVEKSRIYTPDGTDKAWYYTHHPFITSFKGRFYVFYSSGRRNEDDCGQRIMMATSDDFKTWDIKPLIDSIFGENSELVLYCKGCYIRDGVLTVYYHGYEYDAAGLRKNEDGTALRPLEENCRRINHQTYCVQTTDGENWTAPKPLGYLIGGNLSPVEMEDKLLWAGYGSLAYTERLSGDGDWNNIRLRLDPDTERPKAITESGFYKAPDGEIVLMSRTNGGCMLAGASFDGGITWTDMYRSKFADYCAKFMFGTLPDGRNYFLGNNSKERAELVLITSDDGMNFSRFYMLSNEPYEQVRKGLYKGGDYGYPTNYIDSEYMYVVYSMDKEGLEAARVRLSDLDIR